MLLWSLWKTDKTQYEYVRRSAIVYVKVSRQIHVFSNLIGVSSNSVRGERFRRIQRWLTRMGYRLVSYSWRR